MANKYPLVVSFFTRDWEYPQHALRLASECDALGLDHLIVERKSAGGYLENTCQKPTFIRECLEIGRPILWIDVDGSIIKRPEYFLEDGYDFQARRMHVTRPRTWHVGTMYFSPTAQMKSFVDRWIELTGDMSDESSLEKTWVELGHTITSRDIPLEYFEIPKRPNLHSKGCVIFHRISTGESKKQQTKRFNDYEAAEKRAKMGIA